MFTIRTDSACSKFAKQTYGAERHFTQRRIKMLTVDDIVRSTRIYDFDSDYNNKKIAYFDIETTGFSRTKNQIYLIGVAFKNEDDTFTIRQWFDDTGKDECKILLMFREFLKNYDMIVDFNGNSFDIPFVEERGKKYGIQFHFNQFELFDIYKENRPIKKLIKSINLKQKSIEQFLQIDRDDTYNGGQLIEVYYEYLSIKQSSDYKESLYRFLMLHNHDDMEGLVNICDILPYKNLLHKEYSYKKTDIMEKEILIHANLPHRLRTPVFLYSKEYKVECRNDQLKILISCENGVRKYFLPNYKDYYYLPDEDTAIHKSVAQFVDKNHRIKATKDTCYVKKEGTFAFQPEAVLSPSFKRDSSKDKIQYFEVPDSFEDTYSDEQMNDLIFVILKSLISQ